MMDSAPPAADDKPRYHHGDLQAALLAAAEAELAEAGIEAFSLRRVARRAGVSHAAPAHHFGDVQGLLTALAADGFRRFLEAQAVREAAAPADGVSQLVAAGLGYVDFALARPALFRLMFSSDRPDFGQGDLKSWADRAYLHLEAGVREATGGNRIEDLAAMWALAHGLADLLAAGRMKTLSGLAVPKRDAVLAAIFARMLDAQPPPAEG